VVVAVTAIRREVPSVPGRGQSAACTGTKAIVIIAPAANTFIEIEASGRAFADKWLPADLHQAATLLVFAEIRSNGQNSAAAPL
jgi:hypothetical protein